MTTRLEETAPVRAFAAGIGEWLLARRFGSVTPLAFRWRLWEAYEDDDVAPHVVIELLVNDPPPPPPEWQPLKDRKREDLGPADIREWAEGLLWPRGDMDAVREAARVRAIEVGAPDGIDALRPITVRFVARSDAGACGFPTIHD